MCKVVPVANSGKIAARYRDTYDAVVRNKKRNRQKKKRENGEFSKSLRRRVPLSSARVSPLSLSLFQSECKNKKWGALLCAGEKREREVDRQREKERERDCDSKA